MKYTVGDNEWYTQKNDVEIQYRVLTKTINVAPRFYEQRWRIISDSQKSAYDDLKREYFLSIGMSEEDIEGIINGDN